MRLNEFGLVMDKDLVSLTSDGAPGMKKLGRICPLEQQLCIAHGIQLAVVDTLYTRPSSVLISDDDDDSIDGCNEEEESDQDGDSDEGLVVENQQSPNEFASTRINEAVDAVRKLAKLFHAGYKNDKLQEYVRQINDGHELQLILDCRTRWSSLYDMLQRYWRIRGCVVKALIDVDSDFRITDSQNFIISCLLKSLEPVHTVVAVICRRDCHFVNAKIALKFMLETLELQENSVAKRLLSRLKIRIKERWTVNAALLHYLTYGNAANEELSIVYEVEQKFEFDLARLSEEEVFGDWIHNEDEMTIAEIFELPRKKLLIEHMFKLLNRMKIVNELHDIGKEQDELDPDECRPNKRFKSYADVLDFVVKEKQNKKCPSSANLSGLAKVLGQEMANFEKTNVKGVYLQKCFDMLMSVRPTSVESERAFSTGGYFCNKIRSKLTPRTIDTLCFLRSFIRRCETI